MKKLIKENRYFFIGYFLFLLICIVLLLSFPKTELHILSNELNSPFFDVFFKYATFLGDGITIAVLSVILLFIRFRYALIFLAGSLVSSLIIVNIFKKVLLHQVYRPSKYFELFETYKLHLVEGVKLHSLQSFPSGHTTTAFNLFVMMAFMVKSNVLKIVFLISAIIVSYSRVYISQHFLADITAGSVLGLVFIALAWYWLEKSNKNWLDKSLLTLYRKK